MSEHRSYTSFIEGLDRRAARYCARLAAGARLDLAPSADVADPNTVALLHAGIRLGLIPARHGWVAEALRDGEQLECWVEAVECSGWIVRRARRVELRIDVTETPGVLSRAVQWGAQGVGRAAELSGAAGNLALRATIEAPIAVGSWAARNVAAPAVNVVYKGLDKTAEHLVRRPARLMRRIVLWTAGLVFAFLGLVVLILILLHTLPRAK